MKMKNNCNKNTKKQKKIVITAKKLIYYKYRIIKLQEFIFKYNFEKYEI